MNARHLATMFLLIIIAFATLTSAQDQPNQDIADLYAAKQYQEAIDLAKERLIDQPDDRHLNIYAGRALFDMGERLEAKPYLEAVVAPGTQDWLHAWSQFYLGAIALMAEDDPATCTDLWTEVRDAQLTQNVARNAANNLRFFGLSEEFETWPQYDTEHCRFLFSANLNDKDLKEFCHVHEDAYDELTEFFGGEPPQPVRYIVWSSGEEAQEMCGIRSLGFARPELCTIHCRWEQTVGHEMTHVVSMQALQPVARTRLINEGLAVCFDLTSRDKLATAQHAIGEAGLESLDLAQWWEDGSQIDESSFYPVAGAWVKTLLDHGGRDKLLELGADQTLASARSIYGDELDGWMTEFSAAVLSE